MKKDIHPQYYQAKVTCACGNSFSIGSTMPEIHVEICNQCHPYYTGKQKFVDTAGRIDRFKARLNAAELKKVTASTPVIAAETSEAESDQSVETPA